MLPFPVRRNISRPQISQGNYTFRDMSYGGGGGTCQFFNPEFAKAVPTNGFGEVEATVNASLGNPGAPRPRSIPIMPARKLCRIYSPVSTPRAGYSSVGGIGTLKNRQHQQKEAPLRPHTADAASLHRPSGMMEDTSDQVRDVSGARTAPRLYADATESARLLMVQQRSRPTTSDGSSQRQTLPRRGLGAGRISSSGIDNGTLVGQLRPSTSGGGRRRPAAVSHGGFDTGRAPPGTSANAHRIEGNGGRQREQQPLPPNQEETLPQGEARRRQQSHVSSSANDETSFELR